MNLTDPLPPLKQLSDQVTEQLESVYMSLRPHREPNRPNPPEAVTTRRRPPPDRILVRQ